MCGIVGALSKNKSFIESRLVSEMSEAMISRGPDSGGSWVDEEAGIGMGHRRLAILDLSNSGHQPMISKKNRYVISFNGEIYNHLDLRMEIELEYGKLIWVGTSDTETLLECFDRWGIEKTLKKIEGMYAIALWDKALNELTLIRDRFGEKPLYYGWQGHDENKVFLFTSELKGIKNHPGFNNQIETASVFALCKYGFIPHPISIYKHIYKLAPGSMLSVALEKPEPIISFYWSSIEVASNCLNNKFLGTAKEASLKMEKLLVESVSGAMLSDVPVGIFLSSGIDSTLVASIMQRNAATKISAFTIGFEEKNYDESIQAAKISKFIGINHHILKVTPEMMINVIKELPSKYDEPFADSSQIPTYLVSKFAAEHVKVCLTGDGGDELFCGYSRHNADTQKFLFKCKITQPIKLVIAKYLMRISTSRLDVLASKFSKRYHNIGEKIHKFAYAIQSNSELEYYDGLLSFGSKNFQSKNENFVAKFLSNKDIRLLELFGFSEKMALLDTIFYLPNDILTKVDRASMSVSLETRAPFLNKKLFEFAMSIPLSMKNNGESSKLILREVLDKYVPKNLMRGPKKGFSIPLAEWLRGPLKDWAESLLNEDSVVKSGILDPKAVQTIWREHLSGKKNLQNILWSILMFQAWYAGQEFKK